MNYHLGESTSPFIDERDGLTSERERVRMLLSLVAHAQRVQDDGRRPQYCLMSDACRRLRHLLQVWQTSVPATLLIYRGMQGVFIMFARYGKSQRPQHYRCPKACGGTYCMGVVGAPNTVEENVGAYNTVCVREIA